MANILYNVAVSFAFYCHVTEIHCGWWQHGYDAAAAAVCIMLKALCSPHFIFFSIIDF